MRSIRLLLAAGCLCACADNPSAPERAVELGHVEALEPGSAGRVTGAGFGSLRALSLGGVPVTELAVLSDSVATFRVPLLRNCETDGREVPLVANERDTLAVRLVVPGTVAMAVGESRVLTQAELTCMQFAARDEDYVLSVASTRIPLGDEEAPRQLLMFRTWTQGDNKPEYIGTLAATVEAKVAQQLWGGTDIYSENPVPFDARYATAQAGDTVTFVEWRWTAAESEALCKLPKAQVPTFQARVIAATQRVVIAVDPRHADAAAYLTPEAAQWTLRAAQITETLLGPTMRAIFDPSFEPLRGGGGRYYAIFASMSAGAAFAYDGVLPGASGGSQSACAHASEMPTARLNAAAFTTPSARDTGGLAELLIHEYAHNAEARIHLRAGRPSNSAWYLNEAWATLAEETAARIATQQPQGAKYSRLTGDLPRGYNLFRGFWGRMAGASPWQMGGRYSVSPQLLLYVRELAGEITTERNGSTLHQRLYAEPHDWTDRQLTIPHLASMVGLTPAELVDQYSLASVTAGLLPLGVGSLPSFRSWDMSDLAAREGPRTDGFVRKMSRTTNQFTDLLIADGGHGAVYLLSEDGRGLSLEFLDVHGPDRIVRLTRLR